MLPTAAAYETYCDMQVRRLTSRLDYYRRLAERNDLPDVQRAAERKSAEIHRQLVAWLE